MSYELRFALDKRCEVFGIYLPLQWLIWHAAWLLCENAKLTFTDFIETCSEFFILKSKLSS